MTPTSFIQSLETFGMGGNCPVDIIILKSGKVIGIDDDAVMLYDSKEDFLQWSPKNRQTIDLNA
jgi:hypothetical protein